VATVAWKLRAGRESDLPAIAKLDGSFSNEWLLELRRFGDPIAQTIELRWQKVRPSGSRRDTPVDDEELRAAGRFVVAEAGRRVVGYLALKKNWNNTAEIAEIIVDAAHRGRGLGRRFVREAEGFARHHRLRAVQWEAQNDNRAALEFAVSQGFRIAGFHDALYRNRGNEQQRAADFRGLAVFLVKELGPSTG
jgi:ribosomal protein S18 acetylase RimI-like enzyme